MYKKNDFKETPKYFSLLMTGIVSASKGAISSEMFINSSMTYKCNAGLRGGQCYAPLCENRSAATSTKVHSIGRPSAALC